MAKESRADVASSFTLIKGAMVDETYEVFRQWDLSRTKRQNLDRLRDENFVGAKSATWLRDVAKVINRRFDPSTRDRALVELALADCDVEEWKPILLWHITRDEFLLRDFLENWLFERFDSGVYVVRTEELHDYLKNIRRRGGKTEHAWTDPTLKRVASGLTGIATEFGLLRGKNRKTFASYHLPERSFLYVLHAISERQRNAAKVIGSRAWRMYLMRPADVEAELLRLHQYRKVEYYVAGSLAQLSLPCATSREYAERMVA